MSRRPFLVEGDQSVTFVELFFDLVFVFAVTQITAVVAADLTLGGVLRSLLLFWLIWWAWTQFTWTLNPADTMHGGVRLTTLLATASAFVMATGVPGAFAGDGLWFAVPYVVVRLLGLGLQVLVEKERTGIDHRGAWRWVGGSLVGLVLVLLGAAADPSVRPLLWIAAILADLGAAALAGRGQEWQLSPSHLAERHGLFVIIAIGESLIVAGTGFTEEPRTLSLVAVGATTLLLAGALWWSYFAWLKDALEHAFASAPAMQVGALARDAYSVAHFPLVCGVVGFAVAIKDILHHPDTPLAPQVLGTLALGVALFTGSAALSYWRLTGRVLWARLLISGAMVGALAGVSSLPPVWPFLVASGSIVLIVLVEQVRPRPAPVLAHGREATPDYHAT